MNMNREVIYPVVKGDQLCPLGFHPQVRWPTRCKRCFRDYKEHGNKRNGDEIAASTPTLSQNASGMSNSNGPVRSWTSSQNLSNGNNTANGNLTVPHRPLSWSSTPDLDEKPQITVNVNVPLPRRRLTTAFDEMIEQTVVVKRPPSGAKSDNTPPIVIATGDSLAERVKKMQIIKKQNSQEREGSKEREPSPEMKVSPPKRTSSTETKTTDKENGTLRRRRTAPIAEAKETDLENVEKTRRRRPTESTDKRNGDSNDVQFLMQVKESSSNERKSRVDDGQSVTTETTDTTLVDTREMQEEIESLKRELDNWKSRCERAERDKSDILLRRISSMDVGANRTAASEVLKLQQKVNEMRSELEDLRDEKRVLGQKVKELEQDMNSKPSKNVEDMLRAKLEQAESLCEELMDENEAMKKELRNMEQEMDEMHDSFREDQADEYTHLKKELDQTTKNCRILSFKLKKCERKIDQLEDEKRDIGGQGQAELVAKIHRLEEDLKVANEVARRLQVENEIAEKRRPPSLGKIGKSTSADARVTRASLIRSGSQEDPVQLLRDLQDSIEREADLREQLKFAEEEADTLRAKVSRVEDENETLVLQLKKMATKAKSNRRLSPTAPSRRVHPEPPTEKDEGISDEDDPAELRLQLELNEQETTVLRRRIEELEKDGNTSKQKIKELEDKLGKETATKPKTFKSKSTDLSAKDPLKDKKMLVMEDEISELRKKVIEKDRECERLEAELSLAKTTKGAKNMVQKTKSLELAVTEQQNLDIKRQLQVVEQEASVLRSKTSKLEQDNEKLQSEIKKMQLQVARAKVGSTNNLGSSDDKVLKLEKERDELAAKLKRLLEDDKLPKRTPKKYSDSLTKLQLKNMIEELENEITETRAIASKGGADKIKHIEEEKLRLEQNLKETESRYKTALDEIKTLKSSTAGPPSKSRELELTVTRLERYKTETESKLKELEEKMKKQDAALKQAEALKNLQENQHKLDKEKLVKVEKELDKQKRETFRWETKVSELDSDLQALRKSSDKQKAELEKQIATLKSKATDSPSKQMQELKNQCDELQSRLNIEIKKYNELNNKYDQLHEKTATHSMEFEREKINLEVEVRNLRTKLSDLEVNSSKTKRENEDLTRRLNELQTTLSNKSGKEAQMAGIEHEKNRLRVLLDEKISTLEKVTRENEMNKDLVMQLKNESDDLRRRLDDFDRIGKAQRNMSDHQSSLQSEIEELKSRLQAAEMQSKSEVAATRLRYENQAKHLQSELGHLQQQCEKFKRDRDSFKQLLEAAQKTITELKQNKRRSVGSVSSSGDEDDKSKILSLEQQVGCLEDELSEARLEVGKLRTDLISQKSSADIKISELSSKLNEYEEEKLLGSGRTRLTGTKTKLELSWQKEREEQQRLVQETSTLARDLRQTLFEVERERDKERLDAKRKVEQIKKQTEEELEEGRRKISELQSDLLELRDVHAKMRTANEKLRRDRDRYEKERDAALKRSAKGDGERKVGALLQTVDELVKIAPELQIKTDSSANKSSTLPIPHEKRSKSPSPSPSQLNISSVLSRLAEASEELRRYQQMADDEREREKNRRSGMRRAASTEGDQSPMVHRKSSGRSLTKKSLSLDQTMGKDQRIWKQDSVDSMSSMQSIDSEFGGLTDASIQSDMPRRSKKKKSIMGRLRASLSRGRGSDSDVSRHGSETDLSTTGDPNSSKKDLSKRITGMFKRSGSASRGNSVERTATSTDSLQRPVSLPPTVTANAGDKHLTKSTKPPSSATLTPATKKRSTFR